MKKLFLLFILVLLPCFVVSQEIQKIKIIKIIDCNLFLSKNGKLIKLANVETPSMFPKASKLSREIVGYANEKIVNYDLEFEVVNEYLTSDILVGRLYKKYPLKTVCFNEEYLKRGFGKYKHSEDSIRSDIYIESEKKAKNKDIGVWNPEKSPGVSYNSFLFDFSKNYKISKESDPNFLFQVRYMRYWENKAIHLFYSKIAEDEDYLRFINALVYIDYSYIGFRFGLCYLSIYEMGSAGIPVGGLRFGYLKKAYLSIDFVDEFFIALWGCRLNYYFEKPFKKIAIGMGRHEDEWFQTLELRYSIEDKILIDFKGKYDYNNNYGSFMCGFGFIFEY